MTRYLLLGTLSLVASLALACGPSRTAAEAKADLSAGDSEVRLKAARDIETEGKNAATLPADVVDKLLELAKSEPDPKVKASCIIGLGYIGEERAKPIIEAYLQTDDPDQQRWASRAWSWYLIRTGKYEEGHKFPPKFPYGTEGYPDPAKK